MFYKVIQYSVPKCSTKSYNILLENSLTFEKVSDYSFSVSCNEPFTVKHSLITCIEFHHIRTKYFHAKTVKELYNVSSVDKIIRFLKEINLFSKL